jgi:hypothetical protein
VLFLPSSFPFGGMENPCMTFATPTILAGDKSLVALVAQLHRLPGVRVVKRRPIEPFVLLSLVLKTLDFGHVVFEGFRELFACLDVLGFVLDCLALNRQFLRLDRVILVGHHAVFELWRDAVLVAVVRMGSSARTTAEYKRQEETVPVALVALSPRALAFK